MAVDLALAMGGSIGDIDDASRSLRPLAKMQDHAAAERFFAAWIDPGSKLRRLAQENEARGQLLSAGAKYRRAFIAFIQAERMQRPDFAPRKQAYRKALDCFSRFLTLTRQNCRRVDVPYLNTTLPALLVGAQNSGGDAPCMGPLRWSRRHQGDYLPESAFLAHLRNAALRRSLWTIPASANRCVHEDCHNSPEAEVPAKAAIDFLQSTPGIDRDPASGVFMALSLGGYHAPRAAAFEPRFKCAVAWGANYDWGETQRRRYEAKEQRLPVPHYWDHAAWVFGKSSAVSISSTQSRNLLIAA